MQAQLAFAASPPATKKRAKAKKKIQDDDEYELSDTDDEVKPKKKARTSSSTKPKRKASTKKSKSATEETKATPQTSASATSSVGGNSSITLQQLVARKNLLWGVTRDSLEQVFWNVAASGRPMSDQDVALLVFANSETTAEAEPAKASKAKPKKGKGKKGAEGPQWVSLPADHKADTGKFDKCDRIVMYGILNALSFRDRLVMARIVCKTFRTLTRDPNFWRSVDFRMNYRGAAGTLWLAESEVPGLIECMPQAKTLKALFKHTPNLRTLDITGGRKVSNDVMKCLGEYCPQISTLKVMKCKPVNHEGLLEVAKHGKLTHLDCRDMGSWGSSVDAAFTRRLSFCKNLTWLGISRPDVDALASLSTYFPKLHTLKVCDVSRSTGLHLQMGLPLPALKPHEALRDLTVEPEYDFNHGDVGSHMAWLLPSLPNLETLSVGQGNYNFMDKSYKYPVAMWLGQVGSMQALRSLSLAGMLISDEALAGFRAPQLELFTMKPYVASDRPPLARWFDVHFAGQWKITEKLQDPHRYGKGGTRGGRSGNVTVQIARAGKPIREAPVAADSAMSLDDAPEMPPGQDQDREMATDDVD